MCCMRDTYRAMQYSSESIIPLQLYDLLKKKDDDLLKKKREIFLMGNNKMLMNFS